MTCPRHFPEGIQTMTVRRSAVGLVFNLTGQVEDSIQDPADSHTDNTQAIEAGERCPRRSATASGPGLPSPLLCSLDAAAARPNRSTARSRAARTEWHWDWLAKVAEYRQSRNSGAVWGVLEASEPVAMTAGDYRCCGNPIRWKDARQHSRRSRRERRSASVAKRRLASD
jgi:hypothetical protein